MSDTSLDWRRTGQELAVPKRKTRPPAFDGIQSYDYYYYSPLARKTGITVLHVDYGPQPARTALAKGLADKSPPWLVRTFAAGVLFDLIGLALWLCTVFLASYTLQLLGSLCIAIGSFTVVLALLRGQELDERDN